MSYFYRSANAVIAPDLSGEMGLDAGQLGLMTSLFFATFAAMQLPLGVGLDRWGPRWVTPGLMLVGAGGSLLFAVAPSFLPLATGRALIGVGMAGVLMGSLKIFGHWFPPHRFATVSGLLVGIGSLGALLAATPLAWLNQGVGWRAVFLAGALLTAIFALAIMIGARNAPPGETWRSTGAGAGSLRQVFAHRGFWRIVPLNFLLAGTLLSFQGLWAGPYLFDAVGLNEIAAGNVLLWLGVGATIGYAASGWLADRFGLARVLRLAALLFLLCQIGLALRPPVALVAALYFFFGFGGGFNVMLMAHARRLFPATMTGQVVTAVNLFGIGGTFLLQWWLGLVIGAFPRDAAGHYPPEAYATALAITAGTTAVALVCYWPLGRSGS